ncbi:uncharacterized protein LOC134818115 [Bolinopsis microptera]|uniref:uncharacterized protein LOC134818115 n=1 Tax=Bolinopsis microptera TaxID=2820187 RepID=UPI00307AD241
MINNDIEEDNSDSEEDNSDNEEDNSDSEEDNSDNEEENSDIEEDNSDSEEENSDSEEDNSDNEEEDSDIEEENSDSEEEDSDSEEEDSDNEEENSDNEEEALDCSYPEEKDGCRGGWYTSVWSYIQSAGRLAAMTDIPYFPAADKCSRWKEKANGIKNADYIGHYKASSSSLERILTMYIPAAAFTVEDEFYAYKDGVYSGCETPKRVNHGVVIVGYAPRYWEVKNSWGSDWGDKGFAKFSRTRVNMCQITSRVMYTVVIGRDRGEHDQPDVIPVDDLKNVALHKTVTSSGGELVTEATDGNQDTCFSTKESTNPYFKLDLGRATKVQRVEIISTDPKSIIGSKVHIGNRGDFLDKRIGVIREVEGNRALIDLEESVEGSRLFWEFYSGGSVRTLTVCEIRVLAGDGDEDDTEDCPQGTVKCSDRVCRHAHMC